MSMFFVYALRSLTVTHSSSSTVSKEVPSQTISNKKANSDVPAIKQVGLTQQKDNIDAMAAEIRVDSSPSTAAS